MSESPAPTGRGPDREARARLALINRPSPGIARCELTHIAREPIDYERALLQHKEYGETLADCGVQVRALTINAEYPDGVFLEDTALVLDEIAILCSPGAPSRRGEVDAVANVLSEYRAIARIAPPARIDGGDVQRVGNTLLVGESSRTDQAGATALAQLVEPIGYTVVTVRVGGCLHLKSACTVLPDERLLVNRAWLDSDALGSWDLVDVPVDEPMAADVLTIGPAVIAARTYERTADLLDACGFDVRTVEVSEFAKAEGGVTCLSLVFSA